MSEIKNDVKKDYNDRESGASIGLRVSQIRYGEGVFGKPMTQAEFGEKVGLSPQGVARIEKGIGYPSEISIIKICKAFQLNYDWLKFGRGEVYQKTTQSQDDELKDFDSKDSNKDNKVVQTDVEFFAPTPESSDILQVSRKDLTAFITQVNSETNNSINNSPVLQAMLLKLYGM